MQSTTFPNGQTLTSSALTLQQINAIMQQITCFIFGIFNKQPYDVTLIQGNADVDVADATGLQVGFKVTGGSIPDSTVIAAINGSIIALSKVPTANVTETILITDPTAGTQVRQSWPQTGAPAFKIADNVAFVRCTEVDDWYNKVPDYGTEQNDAESVTLEIEKTRVWRVFWEIRGPLSYDRATLLKTVMQLDFIHDTLAPLNLYLVPDTRNPQRAPEYDDGQWWERTDLTMHFNEQVNDTIVMPTVAEIPVSISNAKGVQLVLDIS